MTGETFYEYTRHKDGLLKVVCAGCGRGLGWWVTFPNPVYCVTCVGLMKQRGWETPETPEQRFDRHEKEDAPGQARIDALRERMPNEQAYTPPAD